MRETKFRGLTRSGEWVYGDLLNYVNGDRTIVNDKEETAVLPETVGQLTGLKDKNGVEIYEGDIVTNECGETLLVKHTTAATRTTFGHGDHGFSISSGFFITSHDRQISIIGNIHENPELLK